MFSRKFARTGLAISLAAFSTLGLVACSEQPQPPAATQQQSAAQPPANVQQASNTQPNASGQMTAEQLAQRAKDRALNIQGDPKLEGRLKKVDPAVEAEMRKVRDEARTKYAAEIAKIKDSVGQAPPVAKVDANRELYGLHKYLAEKNGFNFNPPQEMPGGADLYKANDVIQMTMDNAKVDSKRVALLVAKYDKPGTEDQSKGLEFMMHLTSDGRTKAYTVGRYNIIIRGGDDNFHNTIKAALEKYAATKKS